MRSTGIYICIYTRVAEHKEKTLLSLWCVAGVRSLVDLRPNCSAAEWRRPSRCRGEKRQADDIYRCVRDDARGRGGIDAQRARGTMGNLGVLVAPFYLVLTNQKACRSGYMGNGALGLHWNFTGERETLSRAVWCATFILYIYVYWSERSILYYLLWYIGWERRLIKSIRVFSSLLFSPSNVFLFEFFTLLLYIFLLLILNSTSQSNKYIPGLWLLRKSLQSRFRTITGILITISLWKINVRTKKLSQARSSKVYLAEHLYSKRKEIEKKNWVYTGPSNTELRHCRCASVYRARYNIDGSLRPALSARNLKKSLETHLQDKYSPITSVI